MKQILHIFLIMMIAFTWSSVEDTLPSISNEGSGNNQCAVFISATDDTTEKGVRKHNALPFSKEGNVSSAPQVFRVAANSYSEQTRSSQRIFRYYFNKWNNTHGGLHTFKPTIYIASGGFTPKTTYPVGTSASHKRTIYVLRHIIR